MTLKEIQERVNDIGPIGSEYDNEGAHLLQDELYLDFIKYVASSCSDKDLAEKAQLVASVADLPFTRWFA